MGEHRPFDDEATVDRSLHEIWNSIPASAEGEPSEGYDAVDPENLGSVWLERATQTTHEARSHSGAAEDMLELEGLTVSEGELGPLSAPSVDDEVDVDVDDEVDTLQRPRR